MEADFGGSVYSSKSHSSMLMPVQPACTHAAHPHPIHEVVALPRASRSCAASYPRTHVCAHPRTHAPTHLRWDAGSVLARTLARSHARSRGACSYGAFPRPCERPLMRPALNAGNAPWLRTAPRTDEQAVDWVAGRWLAAACRHAGREPRRVETRHPWCALGGGHPAPAADGEWPPPAAGRGLALRHRGRRSGHAAPESGL